MTYYYTAVADVTNVVVLAVGLIVLWVIWIGLLIATLVARPGTHADRIALSAAPACVVTQAMMICVGSGACQGTSKGVMRVPWS